MKTKQQLFNNISFTNHPLDSVIMGGILSQTMELIDFLFDFGVDNIDAFRNPQKEIEIYATKEDIRIACRLGKVDNISLMYSAKERICYYKENLSLQAVKDEINSLKSSGTKLKEEEVVTKLNKVGKSDFGHIGYYFVGKEPVEKFWKFSCPCGVQVSYPLNGLPEVDTRFPCSNPEHWVIKFKSDEI